MIRLFALLVLGLGPLRAYSEIVIFSDNFESGLSQWTSMQGFVTSGLVVNDPLGLRGKVLSFSGLSYQGDIFSAQKINLSNYGFVKIKFDYLGKSVAGSPSGNYGGFIGIATTLSTNSGAWIGGTDQSAANGMGFSGIHLVDDGTWRNYEVDITSLVQNNSLDGFFLKAEDWGNSNVSGDVFFDNIVVSIPEPSSLSLLLAGGAVALSRGRKS